jgi:hypothetical protein
MHLYARIWTVNPNETQDSGLIIKFLRVVSLVGYDLFDSSPSMRHSVNLPHLPYNERCIDFHRALGLLAFIPHLDQCLHPLLWLIQKEATCLGCT